MDGSAAETPGPPGRSEGMKFFRAFRRGLWSLRLLPSPGAPDEGSESPGVDMFFRYSPPIVLTNALRTGGGISEWIPLIDFQTI